MIIVKTLIFGDYNTFTLKLISKLKKEKHKIFIVTGRTRKNRKKPSQIFQEYNFTYDSESISYILQSVEADTIIFTGALDSSFNWNNKSKQASKYMADITNIMINCKNIKLKKFIYISSCSVFSGNNESIITEKTEPVAINNRDKAILMGEKICNSYFNEANFSINILRVSEIYGTYKDEFFEDNICTNICKAISKGNKIAINDNTYHNLIHVDEVIDAIHRIAKKESLESNVYHITSQIEEGYLEEELVQILEEITNKKIKIHFKKSLINHNNHKYQSQNLKKLRLSGKYDTENDRFIRLSIKYSDIPIGYKNIKVGFEDLYIVIQKKSANKIKKEKIKIPLIDHLNDISDRTRSKILPLVENAVFFVLLQFIIIFTRTIKFHEIIDVYLLYVIFIAIIYGYIQASFAVIFSIMGRIYMHIALESKYLGMDDYDIYLWILQIFTIGVLVGYLKDKYKRKYEDLIEEKDYLQLELKNIKEINNSNVEVKNLYEKRLINYNDSFAKIYSIISQLDAIEPERVIFNSINVICKRMSTKDVAIYLCGDDLQYCRLIAASSDKSKTMKKTMQIIQYREIYMKLMNKEIYVNNKMDVDYPIMAGGTYKDGRLQMIILVWSLPYENNNLYEMNAFSVLIKFIERAMNRAYEYMEIVNKTYNEKHRDIMDAEKFENIFHLYIYGEEQNLVEFTLLKLESYESMREKVFYTMLRQQVREIDYIGFNSNGEIYILLPNTNQEEAKQVINRLKEKQVIVRIGDKNANYFTRK